MQQSHQSIKRALTAADDSYAMVGIAHAEQQVEYSNLKAMEYEVKSLITDPAGARMKEYIDARVAYLDENFHKDNAAPQGKDGNNCFVYRSHATHNPLILSGTYGGHPNINNNTK